MQVELIICLADGTWRSETVHVDNDERGDTVSWFDRAKEKWLIQNENSDMPEKYISHIGLYHFSEDIE